VSVSFCVRKAEEGKEYGIKAMGSCEPLVMSFSAKPVLAGCST